MAGCEAPSEGLPGGRSQAPWAAHSRYRQGWRAGCVPARASPDSKPTPLSRGGVSPEHAYRPHHRTRLQPLPTVLMPDPRTLFFGGLCSSSALGPCWAPGLGEQSVCVTHSPGPPLATPLLLGSPAPCSPPGAPKPAAAGGVGEPHGLPLLRAGTRGARAGDRRGQGSLSSARGPPFGRECGSPGKCARGRRPGRHPPSRRGAAVRPAPRPPGSPAFLAGACGFLPAPGARSWLAAGRGAGRAGHERREGAAAEGDSPGFTRGRSRAARSSLRSATADTHLGHRSPRPAPPAPPRVRARFLLHLRAQATVPQSPAEKKGAKGWKLRRDCPKVRQADRAAVARVGVPQALSLEAA